MFVSRSNSRQHHRRQRKRRLRRLVIVNFILLAAAALLVGGFLWNRTDPSASGGGSSASSGGSGSGGTSPVPDVSSDSSPAPSPSPTPSASPEQPSPTPEPGEQPSPSLSPTPEPTVSATPKATLPPAVSTNPGSGWSGGMPKDAGAVRLAFTGDILLASKVADQMEANGLDYPFKGAAPYLSKPDLTAGNLETPITLRGTPAENKQYVFKGKPGYLKPLKDAGFDVVTVANNHTLDQGTEGLLDTMKYLDDVKLPHVGGGRNDKEAFAPVILSSKGVKIAYIGVSRVLPVTDWMAGPKRIGVAEAYNSARAVEAIKSAKEKADLVVVMVHWGTERSDQPNAQQKSLARDLVDAGADLVIGAHPHVLQGFELYKGKWIAYSLGNFIFTSNSNSKTSETGVLDAVCSKEGNCGLQFHPMKITLSRPAPLEGEEAAALLKRLNGIRLRSICRDGRNGEGALRNPCVAHRGWSGAAPENTLAAVRLAAEADDVEWAEIDVQLSSDGIPVLMHDKRLNRTTNGGRAEAARVAAAKLQSLDAGSWFSPAFSQEGVPLLEEVLRETGDRLKFNIELKRHDRVDGLLEERVAEAVERSGMRERSVLTSFSRESLRHLRSLDTGIKTGLISDSWSASLPAELSGLGCSLLSADHSAMNRERIRLLKAAGIRTMVWTLNDFRLIRRYALMDPSVLICTNYPDRWREALRSLPQPLELPGRDAWPG